MRIKVAAVQMKCELGRVEENVTKMLAAIRRIRSEQPGVRLIVFPECAVTGYECPELYPACAEDYPGGAVLRRFCREAKRLGVYLVYGFVEREEREGRVVLFNSAVLIGSDGVPLGRYRKAHLVEGMETDTFEKGCAFPVFDTEIGKIGLMICWDSVFPEAARLLALHGAELIVVPQAVEKGIEREWRLAQSARAFDNGCFLLSCNHAGRDRDLTYFGESALYSPAGEILTVAGEEETILYAEVDYDRVAETRAYFYMLRQLRPEIYTELCK